MDIQITTITKYRTPEGKEFDTLEEAKEAALYEWLHSTEGLYLDSWKAKRLAKILLETFDLVPKQVPIPTVNLEKPGVTMIDFTKPVFTQDGYEVIILDHTTLTGSYPIVGIVKNGEALTEVTTWTREGRYYVGEEWDTDLTNDYSQAEAPLPGYPSIIAKYHGTTMVGVRWSD